MNLAILGNFEKNSKNFQNLNDEKILTYFHTVKKTCHFFHIVKKGSFFHTM